MFKKIFLIFAFVGILGFSMAGCNKETELNIVEEDGVTYIQNQVVVLLAEDADVDSAESMLEKYTDEIDDTLSDVGSFILTFPTRTSESKIDEIIDELTNKDEVLYAYMNYVIDFDDEYLDSIANEESEYSEESQDSETDNVTGEEPEEEPGDSDNISSDSD